MQISRDFSVTPFKNEYSRWRPRRRCIATAMQSSATRLLLYPARGGVVARDENSGEGETKTPPLPYVNFFGHGVEDLWKASAAPPPTCKMQIQTPVLVVFYFFSGSGPVYENDYSLLLSTRVDPTSNCGNRDR